MEDRVFCWFWVFGSEGVGLFYRGDFRYICTEIWDYKVERIRGVYVFLYFFIRVLYTRVYYVYFIRVCTFVSVRSFT